MLRNFVVFSMVAGIAAFASGCGTDCDAAADDVTAKYEECGITIPSVEDGGDEEPECTEAAGTLQLCQADCITAASCDVLNAKGTPEELAAYGECQTACN